MAIGAHPDDIEFVMAGTLVLLRQARLGVALPEPRQRLVRQRRCIRTGCDCIRRREGQAAAQLLGRDRFIASLVDDLEIFYELKTLRRLAAVVREVGAAILLVPSPQDYMEDHTNACRLAVTRRVCPRHAQLPTRPRRAPVSGEVTVYHAMPHGLRDPLAPAHPAGRVCEHDRGARRQAGRAGRAPEPARLARCQSRT